MTQESIQELTRHLADPSECAVSDFETLAGQWRRLSDGLADMGCQHAATLAGQSATLVDLSDEQQSPGHHQALDALALVAAAIEESLGSEDEDSQVIDLPAEILERLNAGPTAADDDETDSEAGVGTAAADDLSLYSHDPEMLAVFVAESIENLDAAESQLLTLESDPHNAEALDAVFRSFHSVKGSAGFMELDDIEGLAHAAEDLLDLVREGRVTLNGDLMELLLKSLDWLLNQVHATGEAAAAGTPAEVTPGRQELVVALRDMVNQATGEDQNRPDQETIESATQSTDGDAADEPPCRTEEHDGPTAQTVAKPPVPAAQNQPRTSRVVNNAPVKVDRHRLDSLIDLIGELVISEAMLREEVTSATSNNNNDSGLLSHHTKIIRELQELSLSLRMVPINGLFQKMSRLVRDLSRKLSKPVQLVLEGEGTELDKTVVDQVADPLMHIVRNALDHGIEASQSDREDSGKSAQGTLTLRAFHQGGNVFIEVEDDGQGLNREKLIARARERGIISADAQLSDTEAFDLIFAPGFSTAAAVTDVSGRGVGMDVVRRNIEALRGSVDIRSTLGEGSVFSMRVPLTLAIIDGMVVRCGDSRYIIPTARIIQSICPTADQLATVTGRGHMISVRGQNVPWFALDEVLRQRGSRTSNDASSARLLDENPERVIVLVEDRNRLAGVMVDEIVGRQQVVIKSIDDALPGLPVFAGGAVMPDGQVGLILDIEGVLVAARGKSDN